MGMSRDEYDDLTPAETRAHVDAVVALLKTETDERVAIAKGVMAGIMGARAHG